MNLILSRHYFPRKHTLHHQCPWGRHSAPVPLASPLIGPCDKHTRKVHTVLPIIICPMVFDTGLNLERASVAGCNCVLLYYFILLIHEVTIDFVTEKWGDRAWCVDDDGDYTKVFVATIRQVKGGKWIYGAIYVFTFRDASESGT